MHPYPHTYLAAASGKPEGDVAVTSPQLPMLATAAPPQFDGPGGIWSPETLLCASLADCFILTFRAVSRAARCQWLQLECRVEGLLEKVGRDSQFTRFATYCTLTVPEGTEETQAHSLLERAEQGCLIANSLRAARVLDARVVVASPGARVNPST